MDAIEGHAVAAEKQVKYSFNWRTVDLLVSHYKHNYIEMKRHLREQWLKANTATLNMLNHDVAQC